MKFRLLRHATMLLEIAGKKILVDPMLSKKDALDTVKNAANTIRIPMTELPVDETTLQQLIAATDAVLITHTHRDHWDIAAQQLIPKDKHLFCQPADESTIKGQGFTNVQVIEKNADWNDIRFFRTNGQHGTGDIGKVMGTVSGYVLEHDNKKLYIAGDTIWCKDVEEAINEYQPGHIIINGGGARFLQGDPITMTTDDMILLAAFTDITISIVHLDTVNHCLQKRTDFQKVIDDNKLSKRIHVPIDGEWVSV